MHPNTFIIGAPKAGTTALAHYLSSHPQVFMSAVKEPHYYATDLPGLRYATNDADYLKLFQTATADQIALGEASVYYLFSYTAARNLLRDCPDARLIVMLRNPLDVAHALHREHCIWLVEDEEDFAAAWRLQPARASGQSIPPNCREARVLQYAEVAALGSQMERLFKAVDRHQVHVIWFDDFAANPATAYAQTIDFLGLQAHARQDFPRINGAAKYRSWWIQWMTYPQRFPAWFRVWGRKIGLHKVHDWLHAMNTYQAPREPLPSDFRAELSDYFRPEVERLSELLHRDLSHWLPPSKERASHPASLVKN